jgi:hypothetical protein
VLGHATASIRWTSTATSWMPTYGRPPGLSGTSRGHLSRLGRLTRRTAKRRWTKVPGESGFLRGAAYRNRTDDLRITRGPRPGRTSASCTDTTDHRTDGTRRAGTIQGPVPRPVPRPRPCVTPPCSLCVTSLRALHHAPTSMPGRHGARRLTGRCHTCRLLAYGRRPNSASARRSHGNEQPAGQKTAAPYPAPSSAGLPVRELLLSWPADPAGNLSLHPARQAADVHDYRGTP